MCIRDSASFLLDTLEFMKAGGRCSSVAAFGASVLQLKPCIEVDNQDGSRMHVGKKYRGKIDVYKRQVGTLMRLFLHFFRFCRLSFSFSRRSKAVKQCFFSF